MTGSLVASSALTRSERIEICVLLDRFFLGVEARGFERDLADKDHALLLRDDAGTLYGFTTLALVPSPSRRRGGWVLYSGDTIVDRDHRTSTALAASWIDAVYQLRAEKVIARLVWLLICSSVRTYRFLPLFFRECAPRRRAPTSAAVRHERDQLATFRYGSAEPC